MLVLESMKVLFQFASEFSECISCFALGRFRFGAVLFILSSAKFRRMIPMENLGFPQPIY